MSFFKIILVFSYLLFGFFSLKVLLPKEIIRELLFKNDFINNYTLVQINIGENGYYNLVYDINNQFLSLSINKNIFNKQYILATSNYYKDKNFSFDFQLNSFIANEIKEFIPKISKKDKFSMLLVKNVIHKKYQEIQENHNTPLFNHFDGFLGVGRYSQENSSFSFVDFLYRHNIVKEKTFGHYYINETHFKPFFGYKPQNSFNNYCKVEKDLNTSFKEDLNGQWYCGLSKIIIYEPISDNILFNFTLHNYLAFNLNLDAIIAPYREGWQIFNLFMKQKNGCYLYTLQNLLFFGCSSKPNLALFPEIKLILGSAEIIIKPKDLFKVVTEIGDNRQRYKCRIYLIDKNIYWVIGGRFLKNYDMFFDVSNDMIGLDKNCNFHEKLNCLELKTKINYIDLINDNNFFRVDAEVKDKKIIFQLFYLMNIIILLISIFLTLYNIK